MKQNLKNIVLTFVLTLALIVGALNVPAKWFSYQHWFSSTVLGGLSLTDIAGSNSLSNFPTTYNANNLAIETVIDTITGTTTNSTITTLSGLTTASSLASIGTITTGVWNATAISVAKGGTGTTTPSSNQVILGDGSSGFKVVNGLGTVGQFLTSAGAGSPPSWTTSAIDQSLSYGFTGSSFAIKNLLASSTSANPISLNGLTYNTPSARAASSTVLMEDGSGNLTWNRPQWDLLGSFTTVNSTTGTTTVSWTGDYSNLRIIVSISEQGVDAIPALRFNGIVATEYDVKISEDGGAGSSQNGKSEMYLSGTTQSTGGFYIVDVMNRNVIGNTKPCVIQGVRQVSTGGNSGELITGSCQFDSSSSDLITSVQLTHANASTTWSTGTKLEVYGSRD